MRLVNRKKPGIASRRDKEQTMDEITLKDKEQQESDKPPSNRPRPAKPWRVAVIANVKGETTLPHDGPADAGAEFDKKETIQAIQAAIESDGHSTVFIPADIQLAKRLQEVCPDICFNISEGLGGDAREAQVPALLEMLHIPYTASRVLANAIALDKTMTKHIWRDHGLPIAEFQEFSTPDEPISLALHYPLFVKPAREGTGMGMDGGAIVKNERQLRKRIGWVIKNYHQPALVEEYLPGREFTVGILGRKGAKHATLRPDLYEEDGFHRFPILEVDTTRSVTPGVYGHHAKTLGFDENGVPQFLCPAKIEPDLEQELNSLAIRGHQAIGALDVSRIDFRLDSAGKPRLIEINSLPGLSPGFSDLCVIANAEGVSYAELILEILYLGASRYGLLPVGIEALPIELRMPSYTPISAPRQRMYLK
jgi:D-alanine-D-alanine ligase